MDYAEQEFYNYLRKRHEIQEKFNIPTLLPHLDGVFSVANREQLNAKLTQHGNSIAMFDFLNDLRKRDNWVSELLRALYADGQRDLYITLREKYSSFRPRRPIWSPIRPSSATPPPSYLSSLSNHNEASLPDTPPRCVSLPPPAISGSPEPAANPSVAPYLSQPIEYAVAQGPALPSARGSQLRHVVPPLPRDEVDRGAPRDDITKKPVPESLESPPVGKEARNSEEEESLFASGSLPARSEAEASWQLKEPFGSQEGAGSPVKHLPDSPANNRHDVRNARAEHQTAPGQQQEDGSPVRRLPGSPANNYSDVIDARPELRETKVPVLQKETPVNWLPNPPVYNRHDAANVHMEAGARGVPSQQQESGSPVTRLPNPPAHKPHDGGNAGMEPGGRGVPGFQQQEAGSPVSRPQDSPANHASNARMEPGRREVPDLQQEAGSPVSRLQNSPANHASNARMEPGRGEVPDLQQSPPQSSCRPIVKETFSKPGELIDSGPATDTTQEESEISDLSGPPNLQISDAREADETSEIHLEISHTSESPQVSETPQQPSGSQSEGSGNHGRLGTGGQPSTSTPRKSGSPRRRPEENDEPGDHSFFTPEPEENSYDSPSGPGSIRMHYREQPSAEDIGINSGPRSRILTSPEAKEITYKEKPKENTSSSDLSYREETSAEDVDANSAPRRRIVTPPEAKETSYQEKPKENTPSSDLQNPVVIALAATVVCLVLYIVWLKRKL